MKYMLDTNICIYVMKNKPDTAVKRFIEHDPSEICVSSVTCAELLYGAEKSKAASRNLTALSLFLSPITILDFDSSAASAYGKLRADLEIKVTPIGSMDMLIAGQAISKSLILVTNNTKDFKRIEGLALENWV